MTSRLDAWRTTTDDHIRATIKETGHSLAPLATASDDLLEVLRDSSSGGKRVRALLLLASHEVHRAATDDDTVSSAAVSAAAAVELFQTAALLHDDVLDESDTRRGRPAAHVRMAASHRARRWDGSAEDFGAAGAILAGDLALMASQRAATEAWHQVPPADGRRASALFGEMTALVTAGQYADMRAAVQPLRALTGQEDEIRAVMRSKTASYTAEAPLAIGAALAGADDVRIDALREIGVSIGIAFQLRDDVLGLVGEPDVTGKPAGDDIREGKRTLVLWRAWRGADAAGRETLTRAVGVKEASASLVAEAIDVIAATDAFAWTEAEIERYADPALARLADLGVTDATAADLLDLVRRAVNRTA